MEYTAADLFNTLSDLHKDVYGFRPRNVFSEEQINDAIFLQAEIARLEVKLGVVMGEEAKQEALVVREMNEKIANIMQEKGVSKKEAMIQILSVQDYYLEDPDFYCYGVGLPYGFFKEIYEV